MGFENVYYTYSTSACDPDGDRVFYAFDWGAFYLSLSHVTSSCGTESASWHWNVGGIYQVTARATDIYSQSSGLSMPLTVSIARPLACAKLETTDANGNLKNVYQPGDTVYLRFTNSCSETLNLATSDPWSVWKSLETNNSNCVAGSIVDRFMFGPGSLPVITPVGPGGQETWTWDQRDRYGQEVYSGCYRVQVEGVWNQGMLQIVGDYSAEFYTFGGRLSPDGSTVALDPKRTYLHTAGDPNALDTSPVDLGSLGIGVGDLIELTRLGAFDANDGAGDTSTSMIGVFSSSAVLLASNLRDRVQGALDAGSDVTTLPTYVGAEPTDIAQDFSIGSACIQVPPGATHLFVAAHDSLYGDNSDPNGDFDVRIARVPACPKARVRIQAEDQIGNPIPGVLVSFVPADNNGDDDGVTGPNGSFERVYSVGSAVVTLLLDLDPSSCSSLPGLRFLHWRIDNLDAVFVDTRGPCGSHGHVIDVNFVGSGPIITAVFEPALKLDTDGDGCKDNAELLPRVYASQGGGRDPRNPWDYFNPTRDGINRIDDVTAVVPKYGHDQGVFPDYDVRYDRTELVGGNLWQFGPPDGLIRVFDITAAVRSYGHDCA